MEASRRTTLRTTFRLISILPMTALLLNAGPVTAQTYPSKPIRLITAQAGGGADLAARLVAQGLTERLGQQVIVDNRGVVAVVGELVAKAPPDGYTLLLYAQALWLTPFLRDNVRYDPVKDFAPITLAVSQPSILVTHPAVPVKSVKELVALAKARPRELNYASAQDGSPAHMAGELFKSMAKAEIVRVNYKGSAPAFNDLIGGQVQLMFAPVGGSVPHVKSGRLKALAVTSAKASPLLPGLPPVSDALPGYEATSPYGIFAPAGTPAALIGRLNQEIERVLASPEVKEKFTSLGVDVVGGSPAVLAATVKAEMTKWGALIKAAGITAQ